MKKNKEERISIRVSEDTRVKVYSVYTTKNAYAEPEWHGYFREPIIEYLNEGYSGGCEKFIFSSEDRFLAKSVFDDESKKVNIKFSGDTLIFDYVFFVVTTYENGEIVDDEIIESYFPVTIRRDLWAEYANLKRVSHSLTRNVICGLSLSEYLFYKRGLSRSDAEALILYANWVKEER